MCGHYSFTAYIYCFNERRELNLPEPFTEMEAVAQAQELSMANLSTQDLACFLGAGAYNHYVPSIVDNLLQRGEFYSAYTPYQPEISQGTLQAIFEYQSVIALLTGLDVANASHYDGATATAEAGIMAYHNYRGKRKKFVALSLTTDLTAARALSASARRADSPQQKFPYFMNRRQGDGFAVSIHPENALQNQ